MKYERLTKRSAEYGVIVKEENNADETATQPN